MKLRSLILSTIVFAALAGTLYWSQHHKPAADTAKAAETSPAILKLDEASITKVELKNKNTEPIVLAKNNSGSWQITAPKQYSADSANVSSTLSSLSSLNSERVIDDKATDLKPYGLDPPAVEVDVTEKDNKSQKLLLGDDTPAGSGVYAKLAGDPRLFTIASFNKSSIAKTLNEFRDKRLLQVNVDQVSRIELLRKNQTVEFGRTKDAWQILQPKPMRADGFQVNQLMQKLTNAKMDVTGSTDDKEAAKAFSSGAPVATAKLTDSSGTQTLQIRKDKDSYYAKSSAVDGVYKVNADLAQAVDKDVDDFRNKKLFDLGFADPDKIEIHSGARTGVLTKNGNDWFENGKKMDSDSVQSLVSNLNFIACDKFVDSGFGNPTIEATVSPGGGKNPETVSFAKTSDGYIAKRDNDTSLYHVQASSVDAVQKAFDDLKPAGK
ncbi:MAG TPA: DUF4340 domain-containing protein [Candidatus Sulfotelmatobacter sp.]|jgi:hypothetical protein